MTNGLIKNISKAILNDSCKLYGLQSKGAKLIRSNSNYIYDCGDTFLRITHKDIRSAEEIAPEVDWMLYLVENNMPIAQVVLSINKKPFEILGEQDQYTVVCTKRIMGRKINKTDWTTTHFKKLGSLTGRMHHLSQSYSRKSQMFYKNWDEITEYDYHQNLSIIDSSYLNIHSELIKTFNTYSQTNENYGYIHNDIHHGNYLISDTTNVITLLDFELACDSWFIYDIATTLYYAHHSSLSKSTKNFEARFLEYFFNGYQKEFSINQRDIDLIPPFLLYRDLFVLSYLIQIWDFNRLSKKQLEYFNKIKLSISKRIRKIGL